MGAAVSEIRLMQTATDMLGVKCPLSTQRNQSVRVSGNRRCSAKHGGACKSSLQVVHLNRQARGSFVNKRSRQQSAHDKRARLLPGGLRTFPSPRFQLGGHKANQTLR